MELLLAILIIIVNRNDKTWKVDLKLVKEFIKKYKTKIKKYLEEKFSIKK
ncbi:hypothetical protein HYD87_02080 [Mycoplasmopsis bovis]|nr:hypothetical protein [Mycoplasmopsis bovis]QQH36642.1 hypothetical protein HYD87_02080 [Mycoplasmopsis bovis]